MKTKTRQRRQIGPGRLRLLRPVVRYSYSRDAYVLRAVGRHLGPVYRLDEPAPPVDPSIDDRVPRARLMSRRDR
jgi:hypothetical protein